MKNLTLGTTLIGGFCIVALFSLIVGLIGIQNMGTINEMNDRMYDRELIGLEDVKDANINLIYAGRDWRNALVASTPEERAQAHQALAEHAGKIKEHIDKARAAFITEEGKALVKKSEQGSCLLNKLSGRARHSMMPNPTGRDFVRF